MEKRIAVGELHHRTDRNDQYMGIEALVSLSQARVEHSRRSGRRRCPSDGGEPENNLLRIPRFTFFLFVAGNEGYAPCETYILGIAKSAADQHCAKEPSAKVRFLHAKTKSPSSSSLALHSMRHYQVGKSLDAGTQSRTADSTAAGI